jgi:hypothetical protein
VRCKTATGAQQSWRKSGEKISAEKKMNESEVNDNTASRRLRSDEMTGEQLFWLGRALFFSNQEYYVVHRVLSLAALKGSDDAQWLLGRIHLRASGGRGAGLNVADQDPRAVAYFYMRELRVQSHHLAAPLLQQTGLGKVILANRGSRGDKIRLLSEAAAEGEPVAFALLAMCDLGQTEAQKSARKKYAADRYEFCGILNESLKREELILTIRRNLVYGLCLESTYGTDYDNRGLSDLALWTTGGVCVIGKELDGCEEIYGSALHSNVDSELFAKECIRAYRGVTHACRRACLCTVFCLRRPLGRDVATMIAKMIYRETRHDMEMWSRTQQ